jgi:acyl transferase domain-containing protein
MTATHAPTPAETLTTPIAIVGMACLFPGAGDARLYWANIKRGVDGIGPVPASHWALADYHDPDPTRPDHTYAQRGGFLAPVPFDPTAYGLAPNTLEATDPSQVLGLVVATEALRHAGYGPERPFDRARVSVVLGVTGTLQLVIPLGARLGHPHWRRALAEAGVPDEQAADVMERIAAAYVPWQEASFPGLLGNVVAGRIANRLDLGGTNCVVDAACASSLSAIHLASLELQSGRASMVLTGGVDAFNDIFMYMCFSKTPALSPSGDARPFDAKGDGTILGEGVGMVVLKRLADAERDGDTVYAVLKGVGSASDGRGKAIYAPDADGQRRALDAAYLAAGVAPTSVELVEGHGTGTRVGDAIEVTGLRKVYGEAPEGGAWCALGSVKSQIGHTKAAAGAAGLIKAALALHHKVLPPTIKVQQPLPALSEPGTPFYLTREPRPWLSRQGHPRRAAVSAFGFGGSNFHAVLEEHQPRRIAPDWDGRVELVAISADAPADIAARLQRYAEAADWDAVRVAATDDRCAFQATAAFRLLFVLEQGVSNVAEVVGGLIAKVNTGAPFELPDGTCFGVGGPLGTLGVIFPGQGAQYPGMGRGWACVFPAALDALEAAEVAYAGGPGRERPHGQRLLDRLYPPTAYDAAAEAAQADALRATDLAQPAIGAVAAGMWSQLAAWGVRPAAAAGHSFGELAALWASGRISQADFMALAVLRGRLMAAGGGDRGAMLAVSAPVEQVRAFLQGAPAGLVIANLNTPTQVVLAGPTSAVEAAERQLAGSGVRCVRLVVGAAFHSPIVAEAEGAFAEALARVEFRPGAFPVYANTTGQPYPTDAGEARALLAAQLARPVDWVAEVEAMYAAGVRTFLEVGPGGRLGGMVRAILGARPHAVIAVDASNGKREALLDLARALAALGARGHHVDLASWQGGAQDVEHLRARKRPRMSIPVSGALYRSPTAASPRPPRATAATATRMEPTRMPTQQPSPDAHPVDPATLAALVQATQRSLEAWQHAQAEAARIHAAFLDGQRSSQEAMRQLMAQQRVLLERLTGEVAAAGGTQAAAPGAEAPTSSARGAAALARQALRAGKGRVKGSAPTAPEPPEAVTAANPAAQALAASPPSASIPAPHVAAAPPPPASAPAPQVAAAPPPPASAPAPHVAAAPPPSLAASAASPGLVDALIAVVADKTGYPPETLELDMALEGDLGIDSIKRVEILSALVERLPGLSPLGPEQAGGLVTLRDVVTAMGGAGAGEGPGSAPLSAVSSGHAPAPLPTAVTPAPAQAPVAPAVFASAPPAVPAGAPAPAAQGGEDVAAALVAVVADKTGYPPETLELDMALEGDLGIDSIKRVEILSALVERLPGLAPLGPEQAGSLHTLRDVVTAMGGAGASLSPTFAGPAAGSSGLVPANPPTAAMPGPAQPGVAGAATQVAASAPAAQGGEDVAAALVAVVADKTGYPPETLELDMALEGDLGIDSIKRVEILSALVERLPGLAPLGPEQAGALLTLRDVVTAVGGGKGHVDSAPEPVGGAAGLGQVRMPAALPSARMATWAEIVRAADPARAVGLIAEVPSPEPLAPPTRLSAPKVAEGHDLWIACPPGDPMAVALAELFQAVGVAAVPVELRSDELPSVPDRLGGLLLLAPDGEGPLWTEADEAYLRSAFLLAARCGRSLQAAGAAGGSWFATVGRLDGAFGLADPAAAFSPAGGSLSGLAKTAGHEWPGVVCQAFDVHRAWGAARAAEAIVEELFLDGPAEVGIGPLGRVGVFSRPAGPAAEGVPPCRPGELVVLTGGARGVTAEVALALAEAYGPVVALLGRTPAPGAEPAWLAAAEDEAAVKRALAAQAEAPPSPRELQAGWLQVSAAREIRRTLGRLAAAGVTAVYQAVDVRDEQAVAACLASLRAAHGPVRMIVHGAGVLADKYLVDKTAAAFDAVFDTKVRGLRSLLAALDPGESPAIVLFSSITARVGRVGQADYALANELLNKAAHRLAGSRLGTRIVSVGWGPWDGGMVTPGLRSLFLAEGVGLLPLEAGATWLAAELGRDRPGVHELVVRAVVPASEPPPEEEGVDDDDDWGDEVVTPPVTPSAQDAALDQPAEAPASPLVPVMRRDIALRSHPFLADHVLSGKAVLPVVVMLEWMAHAAQSTRPGSVLAGLDDYTLLKGVVLETEPYGLRIDVGVAEATDEGLWRLPVQAFGDGRDRPLAHATVVLADQAPRAPQPHWSQSWSGGVEAWPYFRGIEEAYRSVLFHGPKFQGILSVEALGPEGVLGQVRVAAPPAAWMADPVREAWLTEPLAIDCAFQMLILWSVETLGAPCLPCRIGVYRQYHPFGEGPITLAVHVTARRVGTLLANIALRDAEGSLLAELRGAECTFNVGLVEAFRRNQLAAHSSP